MKQIVSDSDTLIFYFAYLFKLNKDKKITGQSS